MPLCAHRFPRPWPVVGEEAVDPLNPVVLGAAVLRVLRQLLVTRRKLQTAQVIIPPLVAATLVFLLGILMFHGFTDHSETFPLSVFVSSPKRPLTIVLTASYFLAMRSS